MKKIVFLLITLAANSQLYSQANTQDSNLKTRYIRDVIYVPLRSGTSTQHRIVHKGLESGTAVTILEMTDDEKYSHIRTPRGTEGWVQTQYLSNSPAGRDLLKTAKSKLAQLNQQNGKLKQQLRTIKQQQQKSQQQVSSLSGDHQKVSHELEKIKQISANSIQINADNTRLLEENQMLKNKLDMLNTDNQRLNDSHDNESFLNGVFAVLIGVMLAFLVPKLTPKKSTEWA